MNITIKNTLTCGLVAFFLMGALVQAEEMGTEYNEALNNEQVLTDNEILTSQEALPYEEIIDDQSTPLASKIPHVDVVGHGLLIQMVLGILEKNINRQGDSNVDDTSAIVVENKSGEVLGFIGGFSELGNPHVDYAFIYFPQKTFQFFYPLLVSVALQASAFR